jgi:Rrf2 family protein
MKLLTRDTDYAVRALCFIAKKDSSVVPVDDFVDCLKVPKPFIRKVLQILNKERILCSRKGKGGGFVLSVDPSKITLVRLIEIFQGPLTLGDHTFKKRMCHEVRACPLKKRLDSMESYIKRELSRITIAALLDDHS